MTCRVCFYCNAKKHKVLILIFEPVFQIPRMSSAHFHARFRATRRMGRAAQTYFIFIFLWMAVNTDKLLVVNCWKSTHNFGCLFFLHLFVIGLGRQPVCCSYFELFLGVRINKLFLPVPKLSVFNFYNSNNACKMNYFVVWEPFSL